MREVPAKLFAFMREMSRRAGADVPAAERGLRAAEIDLDAPGERVDWDDIATFLERAHGHLPQAEIERIGETYVDLQLWQKMIARFVRSPRALYEVSFRVLTPPSFPHLDIEVASAPAHVHIELRLPERYRPSAVFFTATTGELRVMSTLFGRPPARVRADVTPRGATYDVALDAPMEGLDPDPVAAEAIELLARTLAEGQIEEDAGAANVLDVQRRLELTHAEARVAVRLSEGRTVKEIARALAIRESTVRSHLKAAYAKTGARGQAELVRKVLVPRSRR